MNDERLIQHLRETPPEELSSEEIRELRRRLPRSDELRQALFEHLQLDQALSQTLGGLTISSESIVRRAANVAPGGTGRLFGWGTLLAVLLGLLGTGILMASRRDRPPQVAMPEPAAAAPRPRRAQDQPPVKRQAAVAAPQPIEQPAAARASTEFATTPREPAAVAADSPPNHGAAAPVEPSPRERLVEAPRWFERLIDVNTEAYNALAELNIALKHEQWRDACRVITSARPADLAGLAPDPADANRLVSLESFIARTMEEHAELCEAIEQEIGADAWQLFRQASDEDDAADVEAIAIGFYGTSAAAEARRWLGDRAMAAGRFRHALAHYRIAVLGTAGKPIGSLAARIRLAGAMLGRDLAAPPEASVEFGGEQLSPAEFEQLIAEMRSREADKNYDHSLLSRAPPPGSYAARLVASFDGNVPADRASNTSMALANAPSAVIIHSGCRIAAFDPDGGTPLWSHLLTEPGKAAVWPAERITPRVVGSAIYVRMIGASGPELFCVSTDTGQPIWKDGSVPRVACDPLPIDDRVVVCVTHDEVGGRHRIDLASLDAATGRILERRRLAWLPEKAAMPARCAMTAIEDSLVMATHHLLIAADFSGRPRWVRRHQAHDAAPPTGGSSEAPLLGSGDDCVFVCRTNASAFECIDLLTGDQRWRRDGVGVRQVIGFASHHVLVQTDDGIDAFDAASGDPRWHVPAAWSSSHAALSLDQTSIVVTESSASAPPRLRWFDLGTGQPSTACVLDELGPNSAALTPWSPGSSVFWAARSNPTPNLIELIELRGR